MASLPSSSSSSALPARDDRALHRSRAGRTVRQFVLGGLAWAVIAFFALKFGSTLDADWNLIFELRLPRVILAGAVGLGLAVSGAALQALFANPLCEPYTLGISSGAALGAVIGNALGLDWNFSGLAGPAFLGALVFSMVLFGVSFRRGVSNLTLLLTGVMLGFLGSSLVALWMALADPNGIQGALVWLMGSLSRARMEGALVSFVVASALSFAIWSHWRELDGLLLGEEDAAALGVPVARARRRLLLLSSLLVGVCVSGAGMIGFVGLMIPHFVRRTTGSLHFHMLPLCAIWGAAAMTGADVVARTVARPYEIPVGVVTALVGAPLFISLLSRRGTSRSNEGGAP